MKVRKELFKSKTLANGENPVVIRIHHGKAKLVMTGVSTKVEYWNKEKLVVKCQDKNYKEKNRVIQETFLRISQRIAEFDAINRPYDLNLLASHNKITPIDSEMQQTDESSNITDNFIEILNAKIDDYTNEGTKRNYNQLKNCLTELYGDSISTKNINQKWFNEFQQKISEKGKKQAKELIKRFKNTYNWGFENGFIENLKPISYNKKDYATSIEKRSIGVEGFTFLKLTYKRLIENLTTAERNQYTYEATNYMNALNIYLLIAAMGGIAPVDISKIRIRDLQKKEKNSEPLDYTRVTDNEYMNNWYRKNKKLEYYQISYLRQKSGREAKTFQSTANLSPLIAPYLIDKNGKKKSEDDFLLNVFDKDNSLKPKQIYYRINNYFNSLAKSLNEFLKEINAPCNHIVFYSARHTSLNMMNYKNVSHNLIASSAGHNIETLEKSYLTDFEVEQIIEANNKIWE